MYFFKGGAKSSRPEKYLAAQPEKKALLLTPTKHRHSSHRQEAVPYIALIGLSLKLNLQLRVSLISLKESFSHAYKHILFYWRISSIDPAYFESKSKSTPWNVHTSRSSNNCIHLLNNLHSDRIRSNSIATKIYISIIWKISNSI